MDFPRLNTLVVEAAYADPSRIHMRIIDSKVKQLSGKFDLQIMVSRGGAISFEAKELARSHIMADRLRDRGVLAHG